MRVRTDQAGWRFLWAGVLSLALIATGAVAPAIAADGDPEYLTVSKSVSVETVSPGEPFTYTIAVNCSERSCLDATLDDVFPAALAGYTVQSVSTQPGATSVPRDMQWTVDGATGATTPTIITADTALHVDFTGPVTAPVGTGLQNGRTFTVTITLQVPDDLPPGTQSITNTAHTAATNSAPDSADATITVVTPSTIDVDVTKDWSPSPQSYNPGSPSTIGLSVTNASNGPIEQLILQEPSVADDGAAALGDDNPFTITDFTGFGSSALPAGADQVQVDLYLQQADGTWAWVPGPPSATVALPDGIDPASIGGVRLTFTGASIDKGATGAVAIDVEQRASHRETDADLSTVNQSLDNVVRGTASVEGQESVSETANAVYEVNPVDVAAATNKTISPARIAAGDSAVGRIVGTNTSDAGVNELRVADLDYFTEDVTFEGFTTAPVWPTTATAGTVTYHPLDGSAPIEVDLIDGEIPDVPGVAISGFEFRFTAEDGGIAAGSSAVIEFTIGTTEAAIAEGETQLVTTNEATTTVVAENGLEAEDTDDAALTLLTPRIDVILDKTIRPSSSVSPGEPVVTELKSKLTTTSDYVTATRIVVEDAYAGEGTFWDAFDLTAIAPTQVPGGATLTIEVVDAAGTWHELEVFPASGTAHQIAMSEAEVQAALSAAGLSTDDVQGIRFVFDNPDGFSSDTTVTPYVVSEARSTLRSGGGVVPGDDQPVTYQNVANTTGTGQTEAGTDLEGTDDDTSAGTIETYANEGTIGIDKRWSEATVSAQSEQIRGTTLSWRVDDGYGRVAISDPDNDSGTAFGDGAPADPAGTVFDAFDLVGISRIPASTTPFSNGWFMQYDVVDAVELYIGGAWVEVAEPEAGWIQNGAFVGYALTDEEHSDATGFRIFLSPNTQAREDAIAGGDPYVGTLGDGVGTSSALRTFELTWQIRDQKRSDGTWVTESELYNTTDAGVVNNTVRIDGESIASGAVHSDIDAHTILITDPDPGVTVRKTVTPTSPLYVPVEGTDPSSFPTASFQLEARNDSVAKASYIRVTDPPVCADTDEMAVCQSAATAAGATADPFTADIDWLTAAGQGNPFDRMDLTRVVIAAAIPDQVDLGESVVWLLRYDAGAGEYSSEASTATAVNAMTAAQLADVVGISVTFQGADPETTGGTISQANVLRVTLDTRVRASIRSTEDAQVVGANERVGIANRVFAQSYDPILAEGTTTGARDAAAVTLTGGDLNVAATKTVSPALITEPTRDAPVTVTLGANQGTNPVSTLPAAEVRLTDDITSSPDFWNSFDVTGLGSLTAPAGADQVIVSVYGPFGAGGALEWVASDATAVAGATLPVDADQHGDIIGVQFAFSRADGAFLSSAVPAPSWSTTAAFTVQLRAEDRDTGAEIELDGEIENTVTAVSDRLNGESAEDEESASIELSPGVHQIAVHKEVNEGASHFATAGDLLPWDLTFTNTGTSYLTVTELRDALPAELLYLDDPPEFTLTDGGLLPEPSSFAQEGNALVFTWPDGSRMAPGESFSVRILLELQPGLHLGDRATNEMTVSTLENLESCTNTDPGDGVTDAWATDDTTCGTTDYVTPSEGTSLFVVKGVRGEREGATNVHNPELDCSVMLQATGGSYYRSPCAANSEIGGIDDWVLRAQNGGTSPIAEMTLFDQLPVRGDQSLISGEGRGSVYRPQIIDAIQLAAPTGTVTRIEVTSSIGVCVGTWAALQNQEPCAQNGEVWNTADDATDWSSVSGLRITLDFSGTAAGVLNPGEFVDVTYSSTNMIASADDPSGAPAEVPSEDALAWNQFGVKYREASATTFRKISPSPVAVHLVTGAIQVSKEITGAADGYAPDEFLIDVVCTIQGVQLDLGDYATLVLNEADGYTQRIDGIPFGASCDVAEQGEVGEYGETSRTGSPVTLVVAEVTSADQDVPAAQIATIGNDYAYSGLSIAKVVDTEASEGEFGPFDFTLVCTTALGTPVEFEPGVTELAFTLEGGDAFTAPENTIPARSTCLITEADSADADATIVVGDNVTDNGDGSATVVVGAEPATVQFTNGYDSGILTVSKVVDGEGAELYGAGPFDFTAVCTYQDQTLLDEAFVLEAGAERTFGVYPAGTSCVVAETDAGGATSTVLDPTDGTVVISGDADASAAVTATNTFALTSIQIDKSITGAAADYAADSFRADVVCTVRGITVPLGADAVVELTAANGFNYRIDGIPTGASCEVSEQGAVGEFGETSRPVSVVVVAADVLVDADADVPESQTAELVNEYAFSGLSVTKRVEADAEAEYGPFDFTLVCTSATGLPVVFEGGATALEFTLEADGTFTAPENTIPARAECVVTELESAADGVFVTGENVTDNGDGSATVVVGLDPAAVQFTNGYDSGILTVSKVVDGEGAELYGAGPFDFTAVCTYQGQTLLDEAFVLGAGAQRTFGVYPKGTSCVVEETGSGGATSTVLDPTDGTVVIGADASAAVTATNTFALTSIQVEKTITGDAADYAADSFLVNVFCTVRGVTVPLGADTVVELNTANGFGYRIDGIPTGASCDATEQGGVGEFGETSRPVAIALVQADDVVGADEEVPAAQVAELVNEYAFSGLSVTKRVDADAEAEYGPFEFTLVCTSATGLPVVFEGGATSLEFTLEADGTFTAPENTIPARAECVVTEVGSTADGLVVTGDNVTDNGDGSATVQVGVDAAAVEFTNSFDAGVLTVSKVVDGTGADRYGNGTFDFTAVCTYQDQTLLDEAFALAGGETRSFGPYPTHTSCVVEETDAGDATSTVLDPSDGVVVLAAGGTATVTATNTFDVASITVTKERIGDLNAEGARGPFTVELTCTTDSAPVEIPGGAQRQLTAQGGYRTTYDDLLIGADCRIVETDAGGAVRTTTVVTAADGTTTESDGTSADIALAGDTDVLITNEFVGGLPATGWSVPLTVGVLVVLLLGGGAALLLIARRRRTAQD